MSKRALLPSPPALKNLAGQADLSVKALELWNTGIRAADTSDNTISIYEPIGYDWWTGEGVTAKRISGALRAIGADKDVIVNINSPGGDVWEGLAIYNLLRQHKGQVTVRVLGIAASAASFIAMAADRIEIARAGFFMIHNAWTVTGGNRNDFTEMADFLGQIDGTIADIYAIRTGNDLAEMSNQMDAETWINGTTAVDQGFADGLLEVDAVDESASNFLPHQIAAKQMDALLAKQGVSVAQRRSMISALQSAPPPEKKVIVDNGSDSELDPAMLNELLANSRLTLKP